MTERDQKLYVSASLMTVAAQLVVIVILAGLIMANNRQRETWNQDRRVSDDDDEITVDRSPEADAKRAIYRVDYKKFYSDLLALNVVNKKTKRNRVESLGKLHDLLIDFMNMDEEPEVVRYSLLSMYLPERDANGDYKERWLYYRTLNQKPEIQDGPDGPISHMFRKTFWQGVIVRVAGDGLIKCVLVPRGHLKSTIITQGHLLWKICREPEIRTLIRSLTGKLADRFVIDIKWNFEGNENFRRMYGDMGPPQKREGPWSTNSIQVKSKYGFKSLGRDHTLSAYGMESEMVGGHVDLILLDDVMGESNSKTPGLRENARLTVERMFAILDPGAAMVDVGTPWEFDDSHSLFTNPEQSDLANDTSFIVATCLDGNKDVPASRKLTPLKYGAPIWPEYFSQRSLEKKRNGMKDDRMWSGQYFCQHHGTGVRVFSLEWLAKTVYAGVPEECVKNNKINSIVLFFDTASGKADQRGKLDFTGGMALGQTADRDNYYILDGFKEKLPAENIVNAMLAMAIRWREIAEKNSARFVAYVEKNAYTNFLEVNIDNRIRDLGLESYVSIEGISHGNQEKYARIKATAAPMSEHRIWIPDKLMIKPQLEGDPYDLVAMIKTEVEHWPGITNEECLDTLAGCLSQSLPRQYAEKPAPAPVPQDRSV